jgi:hypothetical protein
MVSRDDVGERVMRLSRVPVLRRMAEGYRRLEEWWCRYVFHCSV